MKKIITEVENEGLVKLMGKKVTFFCLNYIYTGTLIGVNETCILLSKPEIVYETGAFSDAKFKDAQSLCIEEFYLQIACIESFGVLSK